MGLPVQEQAKWWGITTVVVVGLLYFLDDVLLPFILGGAIAYMLDPLADRLEKWGLNRAMAVTTITLIVLVLFILAIGLIVPILQQQTLSLFEFIGSSIGDTPSFLTDLDKWLTNTFPILAENNITLAGQAERIGQAIQAKGGALFNSLLNSAMSLVNIIILLVVVPVVAFYLLLDWDNMVAKIDDVLPRDHQPTIRMIAKDIDGTLSSFIRGQGTVCLSLGIFYAVALAIVGLKFGIIAGAIAGMLTFIPYVGALVGGALSIGLALFQYWASVDLGDGSFTTDWVRIGLVAGVFAVGQFLEGNVLTPKLVGSSVGLHPVWLIFALSVFGTLFGFIGMLVAVPVAAMIGVLVRFIIAEYKGGRLYKGHNWTD